MKYITIIKPMILIAMLTIICNICEANIFDQAKLTIKVIDEKGSPVELANVRIGFETTTSKGRIENGVDGVTKSDGIFSGSASCKGHVGFRINKTGYYESYGSYDFTSKNSFRWEPWDPTITVVLKKIENPVAMYARDTRLSPIAVPEVGKDLGFDLIVYDWVIPYGHGNHSDIVFNLYLLDNGGNDFEYQLKLKFLNRFDGIRSFEENKNNRSSLQLPKNAPIEGYKKDLVVFLKGVKRGAKHSWKSNRNYIFRIRSEEEKGKLKKAMYGKILSDIEIANPRRKGELPTINFKYYLNPDYSRNLEFDPNQNLFKNLKSFEQVGLE
jgi:hypothetical protein